MNHGFIGFGNMAKAIYHGLKDDKNLSFGYISKTNRHKEIPSFNDLEALVAFADVIWLGIKPQETDGIMEQLKGMDLNDKTIVSPVAGKSLEYFDHPHHAQFSDRH